MKNIIPSKNKSAMLCFLIKNAKHKNKIIDEIVPMAEIFTGKIKLDSVPNIIAG